MKKILIFLLVIAVSLMFLVISIEQNAYNKNFYMNKYRENDIETVTGKNSEELSFITDGLISYLKGGEKELLRPHFNEKEILHMEDVKALFNLAKIIKYVSLALIIFCINFLLRNKENIIIAKSLLGGLFVNHIILAIIGFLAFIDFNKYFTIFHRMFFTNDLWILDPKKDLMIRMLPENFFSSMALNIVLSFLFYLIIVQIVSYLYMRKDSKAILE